jgi:hypothetical protein
VVEQLSEHELAYGSEPAWERGEGEAVAEQQPPRTPSWRAKCRSGFTTLPPAPLPESSPPTWRAKCRSGFTTLPPAPLPESSPPTWRAKCQSCFTTLPPVPLLEQYRCGSFVGGSFGLLVASYKGIRWTRGFTWFGPSERNTLRPRVNEVVLLCLSARLRSPSVRPCVWSSGVHPL